MELQFRVLRELIVVYGQEGGSWCVFPECLWSLAVQSLRPKDNWVPVYECLAFPDLWLPAPWGSGEAVLSCILSALNAILGQLNVFMQRTRSHLTVIFILSQVTYFSLVNIQIYIYLATIYVYMHIYWECVHSISRNNPAVLQFTQLQVIIFNEAAAWSLHFSLQQTILLCFSFASTC